MEPPVLGDQLIPDLTRVEAILGHSFARKDLLAEALTHRSAALDSWAGKTVTSRSNERLEFLGDRVLGLLIAEWLAERQPQENEGGLGRRLAPLVSQPVLAGIAAELGLAAALSVAPSESRAGVRKLATVLADAMEAVIGALYLDGGLDTARDFVRRAWYDVIDAQTEPPKDAKTGLQEWAMRRGMKLPIYQVVSSEGPSHAPLFVISVTVGMHTGPGTGAGTSIGTGTGGNKRMAEQAAATDLLGKLSK